jgi:hypothetical protein
MGSRHWCVMSVIALAGCATPVPPADPQQAWVEFRMLDGKVLMAERLDGMRWPDGRYFQVKPGAHELVVRFDFEVNGGGGIDPALRGLQGRRAIPDRGTDPWLATHGAAVRRPAARGRPGQ